ncbi:hypothetical protein, partial [Segetibacter sp. 3557_3]|uniref:hypothetical protein n=1 Tax=Segetibacter sp. 3557_3 TaxID=2547429 RepID=UPI001A9FC2B1
GQDAPESVPNKDESKGGQFARNEGVSLAGTTGSKCSGIYNFAVAKGKWRNSLFEDWWGSLL